VRQPFLQIDAMIYFIQSTGDKRIKIGHSDNPVKRLHQLRTGASSPEPYVILAVLSGGVKREKLIKAKFKKYRSHGEWFNPAPELMQFIEEHTNSSSQFAQCRVCGKWHLSKPDESDIKGHTQIHKAIRQGAFPYEIREFMKGVAWAILGSDGPTVEISAHYDQDAMKRVVVYAWWARARERGVRDVDFDDYVLDHMEYLDARESGDKSKIEEIGTKLDQHWGRV